MTRISAKHQIAMTLQPIRLTLLVGICFPLVFATACATDTKLARQESIDGVTITYLTPRPRGKKPPVTKPRPRTVKNTKTTKAKGNIPAVHEVKQGESLFAIAHKYDLDYRDIAQLNEIAGNFVIQPGQKLKLRNLSAKAATKPAETKQASQTKGKPTAAELARAKREAARLKENAANTIANRRLIDSESPALSHGGWLWPLRGNPQFVEAEGRPGVYIATEPGTRVRAVNNGKVIYVGSELKEYGRLILISHADGYLSVYGDNSRTLVESDQLIRRGQEIAVVGTLGLRGRLYFEMRHKGSAINPTSLILAE